jgi:hypothetical protein
VNKLPLKEKKIETPSVVFLYFYLGFLVIINLNKGKFIILMNIKYCLKTKVVGACVWDTPHTSGGVLGQ